MKLAITVPHLAPPTSATAEPVRDEVSAYLLDEQRRLQLAHPYHTPSIEDGGVWVPHGANGYVWKVFRWTHVCADCLREERDERRVKRGRHGVGRVVYRWWSRCAARR